MIRISRLSKIYGPDPALALRLLAEGKDHGEVLHQHHHVVGIHDIDLEIPDGEIFVIIGLSGSGKSTLLRCINRLVEPTTGEIFISGSQGAPRNIVTMGKKELQDLRRNEISMVFQHFALFPHRTVLENVVYGLEVRKMEKNSAYRKGESFLEMVGLSGWENKYPHQLSGGMQQRVGLARAFATDAKILLMDEPFSALDPLIRIQMRNELNRLQKELSKTIVFITHDLDEALSIGNRIAIMENGVIVQQGSPEDILMRPKNAYVAKFVEQVDAARVLSIETVLRAVRQDDDAAGAAAPGPGWIRLRSDSQVSLHLGDAGTVVGASYGDRQLSLVLFERGRDVEYPDHDRANTIVSCRADENIESALTTRTYSSLPIIITDYNQVFLGDINDSDIVRHLYKNRSFIN